MNPAVSAVLAEMEQRADREFALQKSIGAEEFLRRNDEFLIYVGRETGQLLNLLVRESKAVSILEIGTAYGYSTVWLAEAAQQTGGKVTTLETRDYKAAQAKDTLAKAGLAQYVDFRLGDAREIIPALDQGIELVLIDAWKDVYISCFDLILPKLKPGALVIADNMLIPVHHNEAALAYRNHVRQAANCESVLLPVGTGVFVSRYMAR